MFPCCSGGRHHSSLEDDNRSFNDGVEHFKQLWNKRLKEVNDFFQLQKNDPKKHPTFHLILQLYAHENHIIEQLYSQKDALELEFYIPQLCTFLLHGKYSKTHQLECFILYQCAKSIHFAHRMYWFLVSFCTDEQQYISEGLSITIQKNATSKKNDKEKVSLLQAVQLQGGIAAGMMQHGFGPQEKFPRPKRTKPDGNQEFKQCFLRMRNTIGSLEHLNAFQSTIHFISALTDLANQLIKLPPSGRNTQLRKALKEIEETYLPCETLYVPVGNAHHRIKAVHAMESFTFSTKKRVPYLVCLEVVDFAYVRPEAAVKKKKKKKEYMLKIPASMKTIAVTVQKQRETEEEAGHSLGSSFCTANTMQSPTMDQAKLQSDISSSSSQASQSDTKLNIFGKQISFRLSSDDKSRGDCPTSMIDNQHQTPIIENHNADNQEEPQEIVRSQWNGDASACETSKSKSGYQQERLDNKTVEMDCVTKYPVVPNTCDSPHEELEEENNNELTESPLGEDVDEPPIHPQIVFKERWKDKEERLRNESSYGHMRGWRLLPIIVKSNDDLRQEQCAAQLIKQFQTIFEEEDLPKHLLRPYDVISTSSTSGLIEAVADTISLDSLKKNDRASQSLKQFFLRYYGRETSIRFRQAQERFLQSLAAYSMVCYLLQIKDRHNGNLLLHADGSIVHIDFGFFLTNSPGKNFNFEQAPFKLTDEFVELMQGPRSNAFRQFRAMCIKCFFAARKHLSKILLLVEMTMTGNYDLPCFSSSNATKEDVVEALEARFRPELGTLACQEFVNTLIDQSIHNWRTRWYDKYQRCCLGIL